MHRALYRHRIVTANAQQIARWRWRRNNAANLGAAMMKPAMPSGVSTLRQRDTSGAARRKPPTGHRQGPGAGIKKGDTLRYRPALLRLNRRELVHRPFGLTFLRAEELVFERLTLFVQFHPH